MWEKKTKTKSKKKTSFYSSESESGLKPEMKLLFGIFMLYASLDNANGPFPFYMKFEKIRNRQKYHHSLKEHPTFSKIAKFGCEML